MKKILLLLQAIAVFCLAQNPICNNYDIDLANIYECVAFSDNQFMTLFKRYPTFNNGEYYSDSGSVFFEDFVWLEDTKVQFQKKGIVYDVYQKGQYSCNYIVLSKAEMEEFGIKSYEHDYAVNYGCQYDAIDDFDTTFAETEFQRRSEIFGVEFWKFYRKDGTLRFDGNKNGGVCLSENGMYETKKVTSPAYCK